MTVYVYFLFIYFKYCLVNLNIVLDFFYSSDRFYKFRNHPHSGIVFVCSCLLLGFIIFHDFSSRLNFSIQTLLVRVIMLRFFFLLQKYIFVSFVLRLQKFFPITPSYLPQFVNAFKLPKRFKFSPTIYVKRYSRVFRKKVINKQRPFPVVFGSYLIFNDIFVKHTEPV